MANPFAAIEASVNQRAIGMLANADADFGGGLVVQGIFDAQPVVVFDAVQSTNPQFRCLVSLVSSVDQGEPVTINGISYTVASIDREGSGMAMIELATA